MSLAGCGPRRPADAAHRPSPPEEIAGLRFGATKEEVMKGRGCNATTVPWALECPVDRRVVGFDASVGVELCDDRVCVVRLSRQRPAGAKDSEWVGAFLDLEKTLEDRHGVPDPRPDVPVNYCTNLPTLLPVCLAGGDDFDDVDWHWHGDFHVKLQLTRKPIMPDAYSVTYENRAGMFLQMAKIAE